MKKMDMKSILKELREKKGVSIRQLVKDTGISQSTYFSYEQEGRFPSQKNLINLADYFSTSIDSLVRGRDDPFYYLLKAVENLHLYLTTIKSGVLQDVDTGCIDKLKNEAINTGIPTENKKRHHS